MAKFFVGACLGTVFGARVHGARVQRGIEDLHGFITDQLGQSQADAERVANIIDTHWPLSENTDDNRRMKASQLLQMESRARFWNAYRAATNSSQENGYNEEMTASCKPLDKIKCKGDVEWAYWKGKQESWAGEAYYNLPHFTGKTLGTASIDDFHKFFYCANLDVKCSAPPCTCSNPPCEQCTTGDAVFTPDLGAPSQCHSHTYCVGKQGDCCPNLDGKREACCDYNPDIVAAESIAEHRADVPGEMLQKTLHNGHYLGPLKETTCSPGKILSEVGGKMLHECPDLCQNNPDCRGFTYKDQKCSFFSTCHPVPSGDSRMLFVKNTEGMKPHWLPTRKVPGSSHHFFAMGDWGSESCPGRQSMHYVFKGVKKDSEQWKIDHNAQKTIAKNMGIVGTKVKPFMIINAGDNFYWGGVFPRMLGGRGIHDTTSWIQGFENVYTHPSLNVPWISILGNHDYGGDGCMADIRAQFDYTIKDMLLKNRWKMPSAYFNHLVEFDDFKAEFFMLDTNIEDAYVGRHGGICKQTICLETMGRENVPYDTCKKWFRALWKEQQEWYDKTLDASTADWKIVVMHHKPHGDVAKKVHPAVVRNGVQLMIGSHTHEMAFFESWATAKKPLLVVGASGGAQANPGCGGAIYCSRPHVYGFADVEINKKQLTVKLYRHDMEIVMERNVCLDGTVREANC